MSEPEETEVWRPIPEYEGIYEASSLGRIRSVDRQVPYGGNGHTRSLRGRIKEPYVLDGYLRVGLWKLGKNRQVFVHRLVLFAFVGPPPAGMEAAHFPDSDRQNNHVDNLQWRTRDENQAEMQMRNYSPLIYILDYLTDAREVDAVARREGWDGSVSSSDSADTGETPF